MHLHTTNATSPSAFQDAQRSEDLVTSIDDLLPRTARRVDPCLEQFCRSLRDANDRNTLEFFLELKERVAADGWFNQRVRRYGELVTNCGGRLR